MTFATKATLLAAVLALAACANPEDQFGTGAGGSGVGGVGVTSGSIDDPTSPAYFQQAIGDRILFEVDQFTLTDAARGVLAQQAQWLTQNGEYSAIIEGHADERGTREYNLALGSRRAAAVQNYLIDAGVAPGRLKTITYGKERPLEICSEEACYAKNRRAVTVLSVGAAG